MDDVGGIAFNKSLCITGQKINRVYLSNDDIEDQRGQSVFISNICTLLD